MKTTALVNVGAALLLLAAPQVSSAYLDPGTGSLILQGLLATVAGVMVAGRVYWYRLKSLFVPSSSGSESEDPAREDDAGPVDAEASADERRG